MDYSLLRQAIAGLLNVLKEETTHNDMEAFCESLGMPAPPREGPRSVAPGSGTDTETSTWELTKVARMNWSLERTPDEKLQTVASLILSKVQLDARIRNDIQDILWVDKLVPEFPQKQRRILARSLDVEDLFRDYGRFEQMLDQLWVLDDHLSLWPTEDTRSLRGCAKSPGDWTVEQLFDELGAFESSNQRFALFLEGLSSADLWHDEIAQQELVARMNEALRDYGAELRAVDTKGGYPMFRCVSLYVGSKGRPKNLIFASPVKPDLRFRDAINNDIEIVTNADRCLVYDRPIVNEGLLWRDLQNWWADLRNIKDSNEAKVTLFRRLEAALPDEHESPPQRRLFRGYYKAFGPNVPDLPVLLPEVWLHWDPRTVRERGALALSRFRMDFLLLLPAGVRVVVEVDGKHHYADGGSADPRRYAKMVAADRELKLAGYEVFRFGALELEAPGGDGLVKHFFEALFARFGVKGADVEPPNGR